MRIVIPTWSIDASKGGIKTYLTGLVSALARIENVDLVLLCSPRSAQVFAPFGRLESVRLEVLRLHTPRVVRPLLEQTWPAHMWRSYGDVLLTPSNVGILKSPMPQAVVVQSALALPTVRRDYGHLMRQSVIHRGYFRAMLGPSLRRADAVIAVSPWLRQELLRSNIGLDRSRIHCVPEGVDRPPPVAPPSPDHEPTILFVSTLFPYKGADHLVTALGTLRQLAPELAWRCRVIGRDPGGGSQTASLTAKAHRAGVGDRIEFVGAVPQDQIWSAYAGAAIFVYPSQLESFGLPPLEAMASGIPVIASTAPGVRSVVGSAAMIVDPTDREALARALLDLLTSPERRAELANVGRARAEQISWANAAAAMCAVLRRLVQ